MRRGFTLVELLIALVLAGAVSTAIYHVFTAGVRLFRQQAAQALVAQNLRVAHAIFTTELRALDATDSAGSDIIAMDSAAITYKAMRSFGVLCRPPDLAARRLVLSGAARRGLRGFDPTRDSLLVFAGGDDRWLHADVTEVSTGSACPNGASGITISLGAAGPSAGALATVGVGAPVEGFEVVRLRLYRAGAGGWWLGMSAYQKGGAGFSAVQGVAGPFAPRGLRLTYTDTAGMPTTKSARVARIGIEVVARAGAGPPIIDSIATAVALRNNRVR